MEGRDIFVNSSSPLQGNIISLYSICIFLNNFKPIKSLCSSPALIFALIIAQKTKNTFFSKAISENNWQCKKMYNYDILSFLPIIWSPSLRNAIPKTQIFSSFDNHLVTSRSQKHFVYFFAFLNPQSSCLVFEHTKSVCIAKEKYFTKKKTKN